MIFSRFSFLIWKDSLRQPHSRLGCLTVSDVCGLANIRRDVGLPEATQYQITLSEVTRQPGVCGTGQAGPGATVSATWWEEQTQLCPIMVCLCFWFPGCLSFPEPSAPTHSHRSSLFCPPHLGNFSFLLNFWHFIQMHTNLRRQANEWPNSDLL